MYVILVDSRKNLGEKLAMVDRTKIKSQWWTQRMELAMVFKSLDAAKAQVAKMKFNSPEVWTRDKAAVRLTQRTVSALEAMLAVKEQQWHDDDWCESSAYND